MRRGEVFAGRFEVEEEAGAGGMAVVHRARDRVSGSIVALKLPLHPPTNRREVERFRREAEVLAQMRHPSIVRYVAHGLRSDGAPWLAMEWLEGEDLAKRIARGPLDPQAALSLVRRIAAALGPVHRRGIVHRDIKPGNVFLVGGDLERAKLLDFGLARGDALPALTNTGAVVGTPAYMAPEQARGVREVDPAADVFALGCLLYKSITGRAPFVGPSMSAMLARILFDRAAPTSIAVIDEILDAMLAKNPRTRIADGDALLLAIERAELALHRASSTPVVPRLTSGERRLWSVLLIRAAPGLSSRRGDDEPTARFLASEGLLAGIAQRHGAEVIALADGSRVVRFAWRSDLDRAAQAARCALAMQRALGTSAIAIATGRCDDRAASGLGEIVDLAARVLEPAADGEVRIDGATEELLGGAFDIDARPDGKILRASCESDRVARTLLGRRPRLLGRERELRLLESLHDDCVREGTSAAVAITAPVGGGKSRLRQEIVASLLKRASKTEVWSVRGEALTIDVSCGLLARIVRRAVHALEDEPIAEQHARVRRTVSSRVAEPDRERVSRALCDLLALPMYEPETAALAKWLAAECAQRPIVIAIDDVQWADVASLALLGSLLRTVEGPLVVMTFGRPDADGRWPRSWQLASVHRLRLAGLARNVSEQLVREVLPQADEGLVERIVERAGGNPLFLEELVRAVAAGRGDDLPPTLVAVVHARIVALEPDARRILRAASLFGPSFSRAGLRALLGSTERDLDAWVNELLAQDVFVRTGEDELAFRSDPLREVAHSMLTREDAELGRRLAAEWLRARAR